MKYLVKDEDSNDVVFISGETKKEIVIKALQEYLTDDWADDLVEHYLRNSDLTFIDITNSREL